MVAAPAPCVWHRAVRQFGQINPGNTWAIAIERVAKLMFARLGPGGLLHNRLDAEKAERVAQVGGIVMPFVAAGQKEGRDIFFLVVNREHAHADAAGNAEEHSFRERLVRVWRPNSGMGEERPERGCGGDIAGKMPARCGGALFLLDAADDLAAGGCIGLAGLRHPGTDALLEVLARGHCRFSSLPDSRDPTRRGSPDEKPINSARLHTRGHGSPLPSRKPDSVGIRSIRFS